MKQEPILIAGIEAIARALGLSAATVENEIIGRPGFPARQLTPRGQWLTTRQKLAEWAESMLPPPYFGDDRRRPPARRAPSNGQTAESRPGQGPPQ